MKKLFRFADFIVLICGMIGMLLQLWLFQSGPDEKGLYPAAHMGWILSLILSAAVVVFVFLLTRQADEGRSYQDNFPPSLLGAITGAAAGVLLAITGTRLLQSGAMLLDNLTGAIGIAAGIGLLFAAVCRFLDNRPPFVCFLLPSAFFALNLFCIGREVGGEPEAVRYLFRFFANLALIPACYQLWGFSVEEGNRRTSLFWSLVAGYLCLLSAPGKAQGLLYLTLGLWLLTNLCCLLPLKRRRCANFCVDTPEEYGDEAAPPEIPVTMEDPDVPAPTPESEDASPAPADPAEPDMALDADAIIAEILREIDSNVQ